jgi:hypothetical protein
MDTSQPSPSSQKSLSPALLAALGPAEQGSSPVPSPVLSNAGGARMNDQEELKHKVGCFWAWGSASGGLVCKLILFWDTSWRIPGGQGRGFYAHTLWAQADPHQNLFLGNGPSHYSQSLWQVSLFS